MVMIWVIVVGFVVGMISLRTRSILGGCCLSVGIAWTCDLAVLVRTGRLFTLRL